MELKVDLVKKVENKLCDINTLLTPVNNAQYFNKEMMDLSAMICTRRNPKSEF